MKVGHIARQSSSAARSEAGPPQRLLSRRRGRWATATVTTGVATVSLVAALAVTLATAAAAGTAAAGAPLAGGRAGAKIVDNQLEAATSVPGSKSAIVVGAQYRNGTTYSSSDIIDEWTGRKWVAMKVVSPPADGYLGSVWAAGTTDAWAIGGSNQGPQVLHWSGSSWSVVTIPGLPAQATLFSVSGSSSSNVWIVGGVFGNNSSSTPLEVHYDGSSWSVLEQGGANVFLTAVSVASSTSAWAVGGGGGGAVALRYNGSAWTPESAGMPSVNLSGVSAGTKKVWAVGTAFHKTSASPVAVWWNGSKWAVSKLAVPTGSGQINGVLSLGGSAWAVGSSFGKGTVSPVVERFSAGRWKFIKLPSAPKQTELTGIGGSSGNIWAVGWNWTGNVCSSSSDALAYHYTTSWTKDDPSALSASTGEIDRPTC